MDLLVSREWDYFPWLVGALAAATTALAIGIAAVNRGTDSKLAAVTPSPSLPSAIAADAPPAPAPPVRIEQPGTAAPVSSPSNQAVPAPAATTVWECTAGGLRVFSDSPCGSSAVARDIAEPNRMDSVPMVPGMRYGPAGYSGAPGNNAAPGYYYPTAVDAGPADSPDAGIILFSALGSRRGAGRLPHDAGRRIHPRAIGHH